MSARRTASAGSAHRAHPSPPGEKRVRSEPTSKWVRARIGGTFVASTRRARIVAVGTVPRTYAFPAEDLRADLVRNERDGEEDDLFGEVRDADLVVDGRRVTSAVRYFESGPAVDEGLEGYAMLAWDRVDAWYEEDEPVYVHPRDPHHRVDVRASSRKVRVELDGELLAESARPTLLFETGLPERYYLPHADVRFDLLRPSEHRTGCPYKGFASYHHLEANGARRENFVWEYRTTFPEVAAIQGLVAFYNERVDLFVDGELMERPKAPWSED